MPKFRDVALIDIDPPQNPMRFTMDEKKLEWLKESMKESGLLQPIGLKPVGDRWEVEYGHRRFIAAQQLGWTKIAALCYKAGEIQEGAAMLAENVQREEITAAEEAMMFSDAQERLQLDEAGLMKRFNVSQDYLGDRFRLLRGDKQIFDAIASRQITFSVGRYLNMCPDETMRRYFLQQAIIGEVGAKTVHSWLQDWRKQGAPSPPPAPTESEAPASETPIDPYKPKCFCCGGDKDPWNLVTVSIHKWELDHLERVLQGEPVPAAPPAKPN